MTVNQNIKKSPVRIPIINGSQVTRARSDGESKLKKDPVHFRIINESQLRRAHSDGESKLTKGPGRLPIIINEQCISKSVQISSHRV